MGLKAAGVRQEPQKGTPEEFRLATDDGFGSTKCGPVRLQAEHRDAVGPQYRRLGPELRCAFT